MDSPDVLFGGRDEDFFEEIHALGDFTDGVVEEVETFLRDNCPKAQSGVFLEVRDGDIDPVRFPEQGVGNGFEVDPDKGGEADPDDILRVAAYFFDREDAVDIDGTGAEHRDLGGDPVEEGFDLHIEVCEGALRAFLFSHELAPFEIKGGKDLPVKVQACAFFLESAFAENDL